MKQALFLMAFIAAISPVFSQKNYSDSIVSGGITRSFRVYIPAVCEGKKACPLVLAFHGNTQTSVTFEERLKFRQVADTAGFILITPDGRVNPKMPGSGQGWNVFACCATENDVLLTSDLIDHAIQKFGIDTARVYAAGFSIGGFMVYELAWKLSHRIRAFASVSGSMELGRLQVCKPARPVPLVEFHGTKDRLCVYEGGVNEGQAYAAVDSVLAFWAKTNHCSGEVVVHDLPDVNTSDGSHVQHVVFQQCSAGSTVELYRVVDGGHRWPGIEAPNANKDILAEQEIWNFFKRYR